MTLNFSPFPELETDRLILRQLRLEDEKELYALRTNESVNQYIKRATPQNSGEVKDFILLINLLIMENKGLFWVITFKDNPTLLGTACLWKFENYSNGAEVGYELDPKYHRQGIMSEVLPALLKLGFEELKLDMIEAFTHFENSNSIKLLKAQHFLHDNTRTDPGNSDNLIWTRGPR